MKGIMYKESTENTEGVASFEYNPKDIYFKQGSLFDMLSRPLEDLKDMLLKEYAGRTIIFDELYREHSVDKPYIERKNYRIVLRELYDSGIIEAVNLKTGKAPSRGFAKFGG